MHDIVSETASIALVVMILTCLLRYLYISCWKIKIAVETTTHLDGAFAYLFIEFLSYTAVTGVCSLGVIILKAMSENTQLIASIAGQHQSVFGIVSTCILISLTAIFMPVLAELLANTLLIKFDLNPDEIFRSEFISMKHQGCRVNSKSLDELLTMTSKGGHQS